MKRFARAASGFALVLAALAPSAIACQAAADYTAEAQRWRAAHGLEALPTDPTALDQALDRAYAALDVGLFDVRYPWAALTEAKRVDELKQLVLGLLDVHGHWIAWLEGKEPVNGSYPSELVTVRQWVAGWKPETIRKAIGAEGATRVLTAVAGAPEPVLAALRTFAESMRTGAAWGLKLDGKPCRLILAAARSEFVGFTSFVGSLSEESKKLLWMPALQGRIEFHLNDLLCLALENPASDGSDPGLSMSDREKTGLLQHVTQYASDRLVRTWLGTSVAPDVATGIAIDLVIELYGENNSRVFGSGEGNKTPERNKFVRGGRSSGGKLPKISADGQWREKKGRLFFADVLRQGQQEGAKQAMKEHPAALGPTANFTLDCKDFPGEHELAIAPFLGAAAAIKDIPANFFADYQEFLRAYRAGFVHWLQSEIKSKNGTAPQLFSQLLRSCIAEPTKPFEERVAAIYGVPLTAPDATTDALEWQYLAWISKQK